MKITENSKLCKNDDKVYMQSRITETVINMVFYNSITLKQCKQQLFRVFLLHLQTRYQLFSYATKTPAPQNIQARLFSWIHYILIFGIQQNEFFEVFPRAQIGTGYALFICLVTISALIVGTKPFLFPA